MVCNECKMEIGTKTVCPFCGDKKKTTRSSTGPSSNSTLDKKCDWHRYSCGMIGTIGEGGGEYLCSYHNHLTRVLDGGAPIGFDEQADFDEWVDRHRPGRAYGRNPGQWWAASGLLWEVLHGQAQNPVMSKKQHDELWKRETYAWCIIHKKPIPMSLKNYSWLNDGILPPFPPRWLINIQAGVSSEVQKEVSQ